MKGRVILDTPDKNNVTKRKHYQSLLKQTKYLTPKMKEGENFRKAEEMIRSDLDYQIPGVLKEVLDSFWEMRYTKAIEEPISFIDIKAYTELMEVELTPQDIRILLNLDATFRNQYYKEKE